MQNILLMIPTGGVGGMERLAKTFYEYFKKNGKKVKVIKIVQEKDDFINFGEDEYCFLDKDLSEISAFKRMLLYLNAPIFLRKIKNREKIDCTIAFGDLSNVFNSLTFTKDYKIASIHAVKSIELLNKSILNRAFSISYKTSYFFLDKVVCISQDIKEDLLKNCGFKFKEKMEVIYNPHNIVQIQKDSESYSWSHEDKSIFFNPVILFLGRFSQQKATWHLIRSFSLVAEKIPDVKLVFVGFGSEEITNKLKDLAVKLKVDQQVIFLGIKENPYPYIKKAKFLALSSYYEGTPNVIVEAITLNTPIVSTNCTMGIWELMELDYASKYDKNLDTLYMSSSGIITPTMFSGTLEFDWDSPITKNEITYSEGLLYSIINHDELHQNLLKNREILLEKVQLEKVVGQYLNI